MWLCIKYECLHINNNFTNYSNWNLMLNCPKFSRGYSTRQCIQHTHTLCRPHCIARSLTPKKITDICMEVVHVAPLCMSRQQIMLWLWALEGWNWWRDTRLDWWFFVCICIRRTYAVCMCNMSCCTAVNLEVCTIHAFWYLLSLHIGCCVYCTVYSGNAMFFSVARAFSHEFSNNNGNKD